jgi:hypothetical protein
MLVRRGLFSLMHHRESARELLIQLLPLLASFVVIEGRRYGSSQPAVPVNGCQCMAYLAHKELNDSAQLMCERHGRW